MTASAVTAYPFSNTEVLAATPPVLRTYLSYLRRTFFATFNPPDGLVEFQDLLLRLSDSLGCEEIGGAHPTLTAAAEHADDSQPADCAIDFPGRKTHSLLDPVGPQYAAVLSTCAMKCWLSPLLLAEVRRGENVMLLLFSWQNEFY